MHNLLTRSISGFVYVLLFLFAIQFDAKSYIILTSVYALICIWELSKLIQIKNAIPYLLLPISVFYFTSTYINEKAILFLVIITILSSIRLIFHMYSKGVTYPRTVIEKLDVVIRYIILPFSFLILIPFVFGEYQPKIIICILIFIWVNDSFAFIVGKNFGKHKLFERVSPKKTIEGFVGGLVFSLIAAFFVTKLHDDSSITLINWIIIASIVSVFGTIGDLIESKFKRQANIKDSGNIMPGHGGMLDRLDSLYFAAPFVYLYLHYFI